MNKVLQKMYLITLMMLMFVCVPLHAFESSNGARGGHDHHNASELRDTLIEHFHDMTDAVVSFFVIVLLALLCTLLWLHIQSLRVSKFYRIPSSSPRRRPPKLLKWLVLHIASPPRYYTSSITELYSL
jgi:hypothetical protein